MTINGKNYGNALNAVVIVLILATVYIAEDRNIY